MAKLRKETGLTFDDVLLVPQQSDILPKETQLKTRITQKVTLNIPVLSSAMDTVTEWELAARMAELGGLGILHKNMAVQEQVGMVRKVKKHLTMIITNPIRLKPEDPVTKAIEYMNTYGFSGFPVVDNNKILVGIVTRRDLKVEKSADTVINEVMTHDPITGHQGITAEEATEVMDSKKIEKLPIVDENHKLKGIITLKDIQKKRDFPNALKDTWGDLMVGAAVGPNDTERVDALINEHVDVLVVDTAHGHSKNVIEAVRRIKKKHGDKAQVIAGNVATKEAAEALIKAGADAVKVGVGPGSICTTRIVAGVGVPQITAIMDVVSVAKKSGVPVIADGGIQSSGDVAKALASGASAVMIGNMFAGTDESPGELVYIQGKRFKKYRGMGSLGAMQKGSKDRYGQGDVKEANKLVPEGIEGVVPYTGSLAQKISMLMGGLQSSMGYCGSKTIKDLHNKAEFVRITPAGFSKSHVHSVKQTEYSPNYG